MTDSLEIGKKIDLLTTYDHNREASNILEIYNFTSRGKNQTKEEHDANSQVIFEAMSKQFRERFAGIVPEDFPLTQKNMNDAILQAQRNKYIKEGKIDEKPSTFNKDGKILTSEGKTLPVYNRVGPGAYTKNDNSNSPVR